MAGFFFLTLGTGNFSFLCWLFCKSKYHRVEGVGSIWMNGELFWQNTIVHMWVAIFAFARKRVFVVYLNFARASCQWTVEKVKMDTASQNLYHEASACPANRHLASTTMRLFRTPSAHDLPRPCRSPEWLQPGDAWGSPRLFATATLCQAIFWQKWNDFEPFFCYFSWTSAYVNLQLWQLGPSKTCLLPTCSLLFYSAWSPTDFLSRTLTLYFFSPTETKPD